MTIIHHHDEACVNLPCDANFSHDAMHKHTGEISYGPACKHGYGIKVLMHSINELTCQAELDQCGDETSMECAGHSEPGSDVSSRITNKPGVTKVM